MAPKQSGLVVALTLVTAVGDAGWFTRAGAAPAWIEAMQEADQLLVTDVQVTLDASGYVVGQPIVVTVSNGLPDLIYLLGGQTYCSMVGVQRLENDQWQPVGRCAPGEPVTYLPVARGGQRTITVDPQTRSARFDGPVVSAPVRPGETSQDVRALPTAPPPVGPPREVPEGEPPPRPTASPENTLAPGHYRIEVRYTIGAPGNGVQSSYAPTFVIAAPT